MHAVAQDMDETGLACSIVIPCYNERKRLPITLATVQAYLTERALHAEIVIVDDGSKDGTGDWAREESLKDRRIRVLDYGGNRGKGYAVKTGMLGAQGRYVLFMDADNATPVTEADKVWPLLRENRADVVIGSRGLQESKVVIAQKPLRRLASSLFALCTKMMVLHGIPDTQCGFKAFTRDAARAVFSDMNTSGAIFDIEVLARTAQNGLRVGQVPVEWHHDNDSRLTYDTRKSIQVFVDLLRLKWRLKIIWPLKCRTT